MESASHQTPLTTSRDAPPPPGIIPTLLVLVLVLVVLFVLLVLVARPGDPVPLDSWTSLANSVPTDISLEHTTGTKNTYQMPRGDQTGRRIMPTHASTNNAGYGEGARFLAHRSKRNRVRIYQSIQGESRPEETQTNPPNEHVTATRTTPSSPPLSIGGQRRRKDHGMTCTARTGGDGTPPETKRSTHKAQEHTKNKRPQHRGTKHGMTDTHTPQGTPLRQNTHDTNRGTRTTRGMPGARCPNNRKYGQHKVWQKAWTRHTIVLVRVNNPSSPTSLFTRTLCRSPTPLLW